VTQLETELEGIKPQRPMALTVGVFDGVHLGHQSLIAETMRLARKIGGLSGVVTFSGHPRQVLGKHHDLPHLTSLEQRVKLIEATGVDRIIILTFSEDLSNLSAADFATLLVNRLWMKHLVIGPDFALGKNREGNIDALGSIGEKLGFEVTVVPPLLRNGQRVSSTLVRKAMAESDVALVNALLGRCFSLTGEVVKGEGRGAKLGIPTANIDITADQALPADGVYATFAALDGRRIPSITNIGTRPTFGRGRRTVETHLLDYHGQLYGTRLEIAIIEQIRPEQKFASAGELLSQIKTDIETARKILAATGCAK
jgi:riboflavin kinase/FMN adenylyltransferase